MKTRLLRMAAHLVFGGRRFHYRHLTRFSKQVWGKRILEIGSGRPVKGRYIYSAEHLFDRSNTFVKSDVEPAYGHHVIDLTRFGATDEFDVILCLNVMEHIYEFPAAFENLHRAVRPGGTAIIGVPGYYPLHDEPNDYWRFTEHALRRLLEPYRSIELFHSGPRRFPFTYFVRADK